MPHMRPCINCTAHRSQVARSVRGSVNGCHTRGQFHAVLEELAFETRAVLEAVSDYVEISARRAIYAIGGVTGNRLLIQLKATLLNKAISMINNWRRNGARRCNSVWRWSRCLCQPARSNPHAALHDHSDRAKRWAGGLL